MQSRGAGRKRRSQAKRSFANERREGGEGGEAEGAEGRAMEATHA